jgi:hypothetical protein
MQAIITLKIRLLDIYLLAGSLYTLAVAHSLIVHSCYSPDRTELRLPTFSSQPDHLTPQLPADQTPDAYEERML